MSGVGMDTSDVSGVDNRGGVGRYDGGMRVGGDYWG